MAIPTSLNDSLKAISTKLWHLWFVSTIRLWYNYSHSIQFWIFFKSLLHLCLHQNSFLPASLGTERIGIPLILCFPIFSLPSQPDSSSVLSIPDQSIERQTYILTLPLIKYSKRNVQQNVQGHTYLRWTQKCSINTLMQLLVQTPQTAHYYYCSTAF